MNNLDNKNLYKKLDTDRVAESIAALPDQLRQVLNDSQAIKIPKGYSQVNQIVINGMGGSNLGAHIIKAVFCEELKAPLTITPGYCVPASVDKNTLYVISSYSGNTEEPLSTYEEVKKRGAKILGITMQDTRCPDGHRVSKLADLMEKNNLPGYRFKVEHNPSTQPRLGVGYTNFGTVILLAKAGLLKIDVQEMEKIINRLEANGEKLKLSEPIKNNRAKQLAAKLYNKIPVIVAAEHLEGNLQIMRNQFNETSKNFASYLILPDLNHYAMEGLSYPKSNNKNLAFFFIDSALYHPRAQRRAVLTKQVVKKNNITVLDYQAVGQTKLEQALEILQLGSWLTYYLGMLNNVNPVKIPWVDWFKQELEK
ncbi:MAG: SIS domain-containing protein [bacterium]|nr:SIS domain-containing protein [bacterium]